MYVVISSLHKFKPQVISHCEYGCSKDFYCQICNLIDFCYLCIRLEIMLYS